MANIGQRLLASSILVAGLGLYSPLYKQIYRSSVRSLQEHFSPKYQKSFSYIRPCQKKSFKPKTTLPRTSSQIGLAIAPDGTTIYQKTKNGIKAINKKTGEQKIFEIPRNFPQLSWGTDITYDSRRDLVTLASLGGEGFLYRFNVKKRRWQDVRSLNNFDIKSLAYDRKLDRYVAWTEDFGYNKGNLLFIAGTGELLGQKSISDRMNGFYQLYDRENQPLPTVEIMVKGNKIALMTHSKNSVQSIWYYDMPTDTIKSTYRTNDSSRYKSRLYSD